MPKRNTQEVDQIIEELKNTRDQNPPVFSSDLLEQERMRKKGFPVWMYHREQLPVHALNQAMVTALELQGFRKGQYIPQNFPRTIFRRNMETLRRNELGRIVTTPKFEDYLETKVVHTQEKLDEMLTEPAHKHGVWSSWFLNVGDVPPANEESGEDPNVTIARLQEQLTAMKNQAVRPAPGKPRE